MKPVDKSTATHRKKFAPLLAALVVGLFAFSAAAHGPKGHGGQSFTALAAAKKGITLYDKLVADGKIGETWETRLTAIKVFVRGTENTKEFVVQFDRDLGDPQSVYIFFDQNGEYSGSNFTGE
jgi:hypothetical protein